MKVPELQVRATRKSNIPFHKGTEGWNRGLRNLCKGKYSENKMTSQPSQWCRNLVPASPHTASSETSVSALRANAERANSVGICFAN